VPQTKPLLGDLIFLGVLSTRTAVTTG
jgi:hypothetical protein